MLSWVAAVESLPGVIVAAVLARWHHLVERTCKACGTNWLETGRQARFYPGRPRGRMQLKMNSFDVAGQQFSADATLEILDKMRSCPKCGAQTYTERAVTKKHPASPGAYSAGLE